MIQLEKTNAARLVKQSNGQWYVLWYDKNKSPPIRYREKFNLNRIKDLQLRQVWADKILSFLNSNLLENIVPDGATVEKALKEGVKQLEAVVPDCSQFKEHVYEFIALRLLVVSKNTTKSRNTVKNILHAFAKEVLEKDFPDYEDFDALFPLRFKNFCFSEPRGHGTNYVSKLLAMIVFFLTDAAEQGKTSLNPLWKSKKYKLKTTEVDDIALTMGEVERILSVNTEGVELAVRDHFVFACLVGGLRFSDFSQIKASDFVEMDNNGQRVKMLKVAKTQKTDDKVIVPLHPFALQILERHGGALPKCPVNQIFNRHIKEICKKAGLTEGVELRENTAGKTKTVTTEKYKCVSAHTARRTFATVAFTEWKVPISTIMSITGHATEAQFFRYIKQKKEFAAFEMFNFMQNKKP